MKRFVLAALLLLVCHTASAQVRGLDPGDRQPPPDPSARDNGLATRRGHDVNVSVGDYTYTEPGDHSISIAGAKIGAEYTWTLSPDQQRRWFVQANARGTFGGTTYSGWCSPYLITPNVGSPNGYELGFGDASPCSESGDQDWYGEGRFLIGRDLVGARWAVSPYTGGGLRHLSNGTTGVPEFRTDEYLYVPIGMTVRTRLAPSHIVSLNVEFDPLVHGWQKTRDSQLGGGEIPATRTAPAFTIDGFTDVSFSQSEGWAVRASARYQVTRRWFLEPFIVYWRVSASRDADETVTFTVNGVSAREQIGFYEPLNTTSEFGFKLGAHF